MNNWVLVFYLFGFWGVGESVWWNIKAHKLSMMAVWLSLFYFWLLLYLCFLHFQNRTWWSFWSQRCCNKLCHPRWCPHPQWHWAVLQHHYWRNAHECGRSTVKQPLFKFFCQWQAHLPYPYFQQTVHRIHISKWQAFSLLFQWWNS